MEWHINDLSLQGSFSSADALANALEALLKLRHRYPLLRNSLFCTRSLAGQIVVDGRSFQQVIGRLPNRNLVKQVLAWVGKSGPFSDDMRQENPDDYFYYQCQDEDYDVTEQGLGEAARRCLVGTDARSFSFPGGEIPFTRSPLRVQHGLPEEPLPEILVKNFWLLTSLEEALTRAIPSPQSWEELLEQSKQHFPHLVFSETILDPLHPVPFISSVAQRTHVLCGVLNNFSEHTRANGQFTSDGVALWNKYCVGERALFSDESATNKQKFKAKMTFPDPATAPPLPFCPWHGKINASPPFRIHFQWPRPPGQRKIQIVYMGPKLTRA